MIITSNRNMTENDTKTIKGIAILAMIFYHLFYNFEASELGIYHGMIFSDNITLTMVKSCHICVALFVFCTGYGLSRIEENSSDKKDSCKGAFKRYINLVSDQAYVMLMLLFFIYIFGLNHTASDVWGGSLLSNMIGMLANVFGMASLLNVDWFCSSWWYLGLAVFWIFLVPILYRFVKLIGPYTASAMAIFLPSALGLDVKNDTVGRYFPVLMFGIIWAVFDMDRRILDYCNKSRYIKICLVVGLLISIPLLTVVKMRIDANYLVETALTLVIVLLSRLCLCGTSWMKQALAFLGKHSKYMWLIHVFIYNYWFKEQIYSMNNIWMIFVVVTGLSLAASMILLNLKKWIWEGARV